MIKTSIIIGIKALSLSLDEKKLLKEKKPLGVILFSRNIKDPKQVLNLTQSIKEILGAQAMILIDQEGGRVGKLFLMLIILENLLIIILKRQKD